MAAEEGEVRLLYAVSGPSWQTCCVTDWPIPKRDGVCSRALVPNQVPVAEILALHSKGTVPGI